MSRNKLIVPVSLAVIVIAMMTSNQMSIYASPTTEDDGYTYPDDASEEEKEEIDEQEQEAWEDAGRPGEQDNDNNDDGDDGNDLSEPQQTFTCSDGSTVTGDEECPPTGPNPYCDKVGPDYRGSCHDRKDYSDITGLYSCNDGTQKTDWRDCKDVTEKRDDNGDDNSKTTIIPLPYSTVVPAPQNDKMTVKSCEDAGISDGKIVMFDAETFRICKLHLVNDYNNPYYDGFMMGCKQISQTVEYRCVQAVKDAV